MTLVEKIISVGYPREKIYHHYSDLYVYATPVTTKAIREWFEDRQLKQELFVSKFKDNITGKPMYDIAFQYQEECQ